MAWNQCLYQYCKARGGQYLGGREDDGLLVLAWKDRPLAVDLLRINGRSGSLSYVQARIPLTLAKPYALSIGPEKVLSSGVNSVLRAVPGLAGHAALPADFGFPEVTKKRLIRSDNHSFTKLVLGSLELRNALSACPGEKLELRPGPGEEGLHLITVATASAIGGGMIDSDESWYLGDDYDTFNSSSQAETARIARQIEAAFFPRMDRFLDLARAAWNAVTQWPI